MKRRWTSTAGYFTAFVPGRRGEILDAALEVFAEKGYESGTLRSIAARVGVSEPALYRHYRSKEALFADVIATAGSRLVAEARRLLSGFEPEGVRPALAALLETRRHRTVDARQVIQTLLMAAPHDPVIRATLKEHVAGPMAKNVRALILRMDAFCGLQRTARELDGATQVFMGIMLGSFLVPEILDLPAEDAAVVDALLVSMGWERVT